LSIFKSRFSIHLRATVGGKGVKGFGIEKGTGILLLESYSVNQNVPQPVDNPFKASRKCGGKMPDVRTAIHSGFDRDTLAHSLRTAAAAVISMYVAQLFRLPEAYWAAVTTLIVMQSDLGAALTISGQRFAGTALGAAAGGLLAQRFGQNVPLFGLGVLALGILCEVLRLHLNAYRYAGVTLAVVMLVARPDAAWLVAVHRFIEVSIGIAVGLLLTAVWPERMTDE
jgi:uncharacterized membrane protein YccC